MSAQLNLTQSVQQVIDLTEWKGRPVTDLMETEEGQIVIDRILMIMRGNGALKNFLVPEPPPPQN